MRNFSKLEVKQVNQNIKTIKNFLRQKKKTFKEDALFKISKLIQRKCKKAWSVVKEAIGKEQNYQQLFPKKIFVEKK